ncbi:MAG: S8 family serine peptidase, partial [Planctomycetota bacterium]
MRNNRPSRRSRSNTFSRLFAKATPKARKAPRRRDLERLEERQMLTATPGTNEFFANQWNLVANGQITEFDPTSPTQEQTRAVAGEDINILPAWSLGATGSGVQIAIIDGGFDLAHEDLILAYVDPTTLTTNLDLLGGDDVPSFVSTSDFTGTAYAGIIAAADNDLGIVGIAHGAEIFPVRLNPGIGDAAVPTIDAINNAFRFQAGFVQDGDGDGVPDSTLGGALVPIDIDGDGTPDGLGQDPSLVTDVFFHSGSFQLQRDPITGDPIFDRQAVRLPVGPSTEQPGTTISIRDAIQDTAINGRAVWIDRNNDGLLGTDEIEALGSIHIVPAGNDAGSFFFDPGFTEQGDLASSQYDELANSIYTIAVGAVDYDGTFENPATGTLGTYSEGGANILLVAPSGNFAQDITTSSGLNSGLVTTDITGEGGNNQSPVFNFEFDGDFFADIDYTSQVSGTEAAAAQVAAVVGLMLEVNPLLSQRDVQQILMMSARQNDEFSETWITNLIQDFEDPNIPQYVSYAIDNEGDGDIDIEAAIIPNSEYDPEAGDFFNELGFYSNENAVADLGEPFVFAPNNRRIDPNDPASPPLFFDSVDDLGFPIPRFTSGGVALGAAVPVNDPMTGELLGYIEVGANGDPIAIDMPIPEGAPLPAGAVPIVELGVRDVNTAAEGDPDSFMTETFVALVYEANGNLARGVVQVLGDDSRPQFVDPEAMPLVPILGDAPVTTSVGPLVVADPGVVAFGPNAPDPLVVFAENTIADDQRGGLGPLVTPLRDRSELNPLLFENGAGFTVSSGYGTLLEDVSYGHGVLDAALAVELAIAWDTYDLFLDDSATITSGVQGGTVDFTLQSAINITLDNVIVLSVPGGIIEPGGEQLNAGFYNEFFADIDATDVPGGEVITAAPFFNLDDIPDSNRGFTEIPFNFEGSLNEEFLTLEWIEVTASITSGDPDNIRMSIRAPDGTQTELNAFRAGLQPDYVQQDPQGQQGATLPGEEPIKLFEGGLDIGAQGKIIDNTVVQQGGGIDSATEFLPAIDNADPDADPLGQSWTWTTNRHWGEIFSTRGNSLDLIRDNLGEPGYFPTEGWSLIIENHDIGAGATLGGQIEIALHGTEATGNRIQGKVGVDDNKQGIAGTQNDENFNFNRHIEFGVVDVVFTNDVGKTFLPEQFPLVLDDLTDSVTFSNTNGIGPNGFSLDNIYKTVDPDTGEELFYPVVNKADYLALRTSDDAAIAVIEAVQEFIRAVENDPTIFITNAELATTYNRFADPRDTATVNEAVVDGFY